MAAVTASAPSAVDPALRDLVPARTNGPAAGDRSPAGARPDRTVRSWPLLVLAAPAEIARVARPWVTTGVDPTTGKNSRTSTPAD
ncbi:MAG: hypothetical protein ABSA53_05975 [Streptosporangiaceae bacterium]|jgi:hypothetical protein